MNAIGGFKSRFTFNDDNLFFFLNLGSLIYYDMYKLNLLNLQNLQVFDPNSKKQLPIQSYLEQTKHNIHESLVLLPFNSNDQKLSIIDNRTGKLEFLPVYKNTISAIEFKKFIGHNDETLEDSSGIMIYDPAFQNTAVTKSSITYIDGDKGILHYRGYPIEELAEKSNFIEVSYLLIYGELPTKIQYDIWNEQIMKHTFLHIRMTELMKTFNYDAHPMGMFISSMAAMSTFHPEANPALRGMDIYKNDKLVLNKQIVRILGKAPTVAACAYRHRIGRPYNYPQNQLSYTENFLYMLDRLSEINYTPHPVLVKALDILFILHADHELNCSTAAMRHIGSTLVDPYSAIAGASAALYGPLHGGANEAVLKMLDEIHDVKNVPAFIDQVKDKKKKLMGFGHRIYKNYDPRAKIIQKLAYEVFEVLGKEPLIEVALELEKVALSDTYFIERKLYPNVDFYSGLIYKAMGFPTDFFPVLFAIPRIAGWLAHWKEAIEESDGKIWRPRQIYEGADLRPYVNMDQRSTPDTEEVVKTAITSHPFSKRRVVSVMSKL